jgi:hypothetical protein
MNLDCSECVCVCVCVRDTADDRHVALGCEERGGGHLGPQMAMMCFTASSLSAVCSCSSRMCNSHCTTTARTRDQPRLPTSTRPLFSPSLRIMDAAYGRSFDMLLHFIFEKTSEHKHPSLPNTYTHHFQIHVNKQHWPSFKQNTCMETPSHCKKRVCACVCISWVDALRLSCSAGVPPRRPKWT